MIDRKSTLNVSSVKKLSVSGLSERREAEVRRVSGASAPHWELRPAQDWDHGRVGGMQTVVPILSHLQEARYRLQCGAQASRALALVVDDRNGKVVRHIGAERAVRGLRGRRRVHDISLR